MCSIVLWWGGLPIFRVSFIGGFTGRHNYGTNLPLNGSHASIRSSAAPLRIIKSLWLAHEWFTVYCPYLPLNRPFLVQFHLCRPANSHSFPMFQYTAIFFLCTLTVASWQISYSFRLAGLRLRKLNLLSQMCFSLCMILQCPEDCELRVQLILSTDDYENWQLLTSSTDLIIIQAPPITTSRNVLAVPPTCVLWFQYKGAPFFSDISTFHYINCV